MGGGLEKLLKPYRRGGSRNKKEGRIFIIFTTKFGYLWQNLSANVFYELLEGKIVENKKAKFSHAKQIFFTFFRNASEYEY